MAASASTSSAEPTAARKLWVHLDVNKTLIAIDPASGQDLQTALNGGIGMVAHGKVLPTPDGCQIRPYLVKEDTFVMPDGTTRPLADGKGFQFLEPAVGMAVDTPKELPDGAGPEDCFPLVRFVDDCLFPYLEEVGCEARGMDPKAVRASNHELKLARRRLLARVLGPDGIGGKLYASVTASLQEALGVPEHQQEAYAESGFSADGKGKCRFLIPAYFRLLDWLAANRPDATVVFRTFGSDVPEIVAEHNAYCEGRHPLYDSASRLDGTDGRADWRVGMPHATGRILRFADDKAGIAMAAVTVESGDKEAAAGPATFFRGAEEIHHELVARRALGFRAMAIQDDYQWWKQHDETGPFGKVLLVKDTAAGLRAELSVFFDDNIVSTRAKIVDARDYHSGENVPFQRSKNLYLRTASVPAALLDPDFFINGVLASEAKADGLIASSE